MVGERPRPPMGAAAVERRVVRSAALDAARRASRGGAMGHGHQPPLPELPRGPVASPRHLAPALSGGGARRPDRGYPRAPRSAGPAQASARLRVVGPGEPLATAVGPSAL